MAERVPSPNAERVELIVIPDDDAEQVEVVRMNLEALAPGTRRRRSRPSTNGFIQYARQLQRELHVDLHQAIEVADIRWPNMDGEARRPYRERALEERARMPPRPCERPDCELTRERLRRLLEVEENQAVQHDN